VSVYWLERRQEDVPPVDDWFGPRELLRLRTLKVPHRRADWRLGRWTAKCAVAAFLNFYRDPDLFRDIEICAADSGAPRLFIRDNPSDLSLSLSHRSGMSICAIADNRARLGCDLEIIEPRSDAFAKDYFAAEERSLVENAPEADRSRLLALLWSAKESALKALEEGLRRDTRSVVVRLHDPQFGGAWNSFQVDCVEGGSFRGWWQATGSAIRTFVADQFLAPPVSMQAPVSALPDDCSASRRV
jgi:4'-phosphopantetheinyl transferase